MNESSPANVENKITTCQTTAIELDDENLSLKGVENDLYQMSFLLAIFDNIVGPKVIHYWRTESSRKSANVKRYSSIDDQLLKYIAIHTLNGELYQDKLTNQQKFRLYLIKEVECAVFSVFFDASTISSSSYGSSNCSADLGVDEEDNSSVLSGSSENLTQSNKNKVSTSLNCFSIIVPLEKKDIFLKNYGDNTNFFVNSFENIILEYKVFAQIKPKVINYNLHFFTKSNFYLNFNYFQKSNQITKAINNLSESIITFCSSLNTLRSRGLYPSHIDTEYNTFKTPYRIHVSLFCL